MTAATTNRPGPLQTWLVESLAGVKRATKAERELVARTVRDSVGVALAGAGQRSVEAALELAHRSGSAGPATVWGTKLSLDRCSAALVNGTAIQALEFDDISPPVASHLSSVIAPTLSAFGDELEPERAEDGVVHALRVTGSLGQLIGFHSHRRGLQPTHTLGPIAATLAAGHGLGFDGDQLGSALALAVTGPIGLRANTGTPAKALQSGLAASTAVRAIEMARTGAVAGAAAVDSVFALLGADDDAIGRVVSAPLPSPVYLAVKPYPTSGAVHSAIEALLAVRNRFPAGTVPDRLEVRVPPRILVAMAFGRPTNADEARWSLRYALATAWEKGDVEVGDFDESVVAETSARRSPDWMEFTGDETFEPRGDQAHVRLVAGSKVEESYVEFRLGYPRRPLSISSIRSKFDRCLAAAGREEIADTVWSGLDEAPYARVGELTTT